MTEFQSATVSPPYVTSMNHKLPVTTAWEEVAVENQPMQLFVACPENCGKWPALILFMEIFGINNHIQNLAKALAGEGYVVYAPNYFHRTASDLKLGYTDADTAQGREHKNQVQLEHLLKDIEAILATIKTDNRVADAEKIGCVGFCFGGHVAVIASQFPQIQATAAFYPGGVCTLSPGGGIPTLDRLAPFSAELLCFFGLNDPLIPVREIDLLDNKLRSLKVKYDVIRYNNTGHGFFCDERADFDPSAAEDSWARLKLLFARKLKSSLEAV